MPAKKPKKRSNPLCGKPTGKTKAAFERAAKAIRSGKRPSAGKGRARPIRDKEYDVFRKALEKLTSDLGGMQAIAAAHSNGPKDQNTLDLSNIVSIGIGTKYEGGSPQPKLCLRVNVIRKKKPEDKNLKVSKDAEIKEYITINGIKIPTDVHEIGRIAPRQLLWSPSFPAARPVLPNAYIKAEKPLRPGSTVGHPKITAGTFGALCIADKSIYPADGGVRCMLSNSHVFAHADSDQPSIKGLIKSGKSWEDAFDGAADTLHPGPADVVSGKKQVGKLYVVADLNFSGGSNIVDAALSYVVDGDLVAGMFHQLPKIPDDGKKGRDVGPSDVNNLVPVWKEGRTTGATSGFVTAISKQVTIPYDLPNGTRVQAVFTDQIEIHSRFSVPFSLPGDSGSVIVDNNSIPIGLLFAGGENGMVTFANPIKKVMAELGIDQFWHAEMND